MRKRDVSKRTSYEIPDVEPVNNKVSLVLPRIPNETYPNFFRQVVMPPHHRFILGAGLFKNLDRGEVIVTTKQSFAGIALDSLADGFSDVT